MIAFPSNRKLASAAQFENSFNVVGISALEAAGQHWHELGHLFTVLHCAM